MKEDSEMFQKDSGEERGMHKLIGLWSKCKYEIGAYDKDNKNMLAVNET